MKKINQNEMASLEGGIRWGSFAKGFCSGVGYGLFVTSVFGLAGGIMGGVGVTGACLAIGEL